MKRRTRDELRTVATCALALAVGSLAAGCGGGDDAKKEKPAASAGPTSAAPASAPAAKATQAPAAPPAADKAPASDKAADAPAAGKSPVPATEEWNAVTGEVTVRGSSALGCETKGLREWVRVSCRGDDPARGTPLRVTVNDSKGAETFTFGSGGITSLVYRFEEGTKIEASFGWSKLGKKFVAEWPAGAPKPQAYGEFL
jgi:hypothetical protein